MMFQVLTPFYALARGSPLITIKPTELRKRRRKERDSQRRMRTVECIVFLTVIWFFFTSAVVEGACKEEALADVKGEMLLTSSGAAYRVGNPGIDIAFWLPPARIVICDRINMKGESYYAISNKDANETVWATKIVTDETL